ncbi:MAG: hypothetical protein K9N06_00855 [Candidatus Cloacimonetes bacterium]|nr:hypothetical protein [Candidatus Cloacimonadota bacterium]
MKIRITMLLMIGILLGQLQGAELHPDHYYIELIKHYMSLGEYDLALQVAETNPDVDSPDSLAWLQGQIYKFRQENKKAVDYFIETIIITENQDLQNLAYDDLERLLRAMDPIEVIEILTNLLETVKGDLYLRIILKLAEIYESKSLYEEANDIYISLLNGENFRDTLGLRIKVATNSMFRKNYDQAIRFARQSQNESDSLFIPQALFIEFMGYYSQNKLDKALIPLLKLYLEYPVFSRKFEIYLSLVELFLYKGEDLAALYLLEEYYPLAGLLEKRIIDEKVQTILDNLQEKPGRHQLFKLFKPDFGKLLHR